MMRARSKDIIFLLGAGASAEAGIPTSAAMINEIETNLREKPRWKAYYDLYNHVKSAIYYSSGLRGYFNEDVHFNIETLVNTLYELERNEDHPLYPFIASWNSRFVSLAKPDFKAVRDFRMLILGALKKWMCPERTSAREYYSGFARIQQDFNFPLPIFSLNYDLCVEKLENDSFKVETGFSGYGIEHKWDWERFEEQGPNPLPQIVLYKLHGSINWKRNHSTKDLSCVDQIETIDPDEMEIIFGKDFKLDAADPYLFYVYAFRSHTLSASLIVIIGYGFGDEHINKILTQGLQSSKDRNLLVVCNCSENGKDRRLNEIQQSLNLEGETSQIHIFQGRAKQFLEKPDLSTYLQENMPEVRDAPF